MDRTPLEVSAALAGVRRRARLLEEAGGEWSGRDVASAVPVAVAAYLIWFGSGDVSNTTVGFILLVAAISGWQHHRLRARVEAMAALLKEIGYPREA